jgi:hypothetical protein
LFATLCMIISGWNAANQLGDSVFVMPGLVPGIHVFLCSGDR